MPFIFSVEDMASFLKFSKKKKKKSLVFDSYGFGRIHITIELGPDSLVFLKVNDVLSKTDRKSVV